MSKYREMAEIFLDGNKKKDGWLAIGYDVPKLAEALEVLDKKNQLFEYRNYLGKLLFFVGWIWCVEKDKERLLKNEPIPHSEDGKHLFPLFLGGKVDKTTMKMGYKMFLKKAREMGGEVISFRHGRVKDTGGLHV